MSKRMKDIWLRKGKRGFTLIELMAVMAILAVLVAIVAPAVINSERASITAQAQADAQQLRNASTEFFSKQNEFEVKTPHTITLTTKVNTLTIAASAQKVSSRWPESFISAGSGVPTLTPKKTNNSRYSAVFETAASPKIIDVTLLETDGVTAITGADLLTKYTAIDAQLLVNKGRLKKLPEGWDKKSGTGIGSGIDELKVPNILWLFKKIDSSIGVEDDRNIAVFLLVKVDLIEPPPSTLGGGATTTNLTYQQILG